MRLKRNYDKLIFNTYSISIQIIIKIWLIQRLSKTFRHLSILNYKRRDQIDMVIEESIIKLFGGKLKEYNSSEIIFSEKSNANHYYQIVEGEVKLNNYNEGGKETIQTILKKGQSIGESLLFLDKAYPVNAIAITTCKVLRLPKSKFFQILNKSPEIQIQIINSLSDSMYFKYIMGQIFSTKNPATKLRVLMDYLKSSEKDLSSFSFQVPLTRQQMASLTGLRVETTIRALKMMEKENVVKIQNRKIFY